MPTAMVGSVGSPSMAEDCLHFEGLVRGFGPVPVLAGVSGARAARRAAARHRQQRRGEEHAAALPGRPAAPAGGYRPAARGRGRARRGEPPAPRRLRRARPRLLRAAVRGARTLPSSAACAASRPSAATSCWRSSACPPAAPPARSPRACGSACAGRGRSSTGRACCCSTSRSRTSTPLARRRCARCSTAHLETGGMAVVATPTSLDLPRVAATLELVPPSAPRRAA